MKGKSFFNLNIGNILENYTKGTLSPIDVAEICCRQVNLFEERYQAWVIFDKKILMNQARASEEQLRKIGTIRGLEGIPVGVKDIINTRDFTTEMGSSIWKDFTPGNDARIIYNLRQAGAVIPGKTVTAEFAVHTLGKSLNPHDPSRTPGTSSSGSAVAVATGMVPIALGTQTAGSIVRPASFCGIYGFKPSFGLIPRTGILKTTDSLDTVGYFALHYCDIKRLFDIITVQGPNYPFSHSSLTDPKRQIKPADRPWRVALIKTHIWDYAPDYAKSALLKWADALGSTDMISIKEELLPEGMERSHAIHATIYNRTLAYYFKEEFNKGTLVSKTMKSLIEDGGRITVDQYVSALKEQEKLIHLMEAFFDDFDILICLSTAGEAPLRGVEEIPDASLIWTMTHLPAISIPVFISPKGLPFGAQIVAKKYNDKLLLQFCSYLRELNLIPEGSNPRVKI